MDTPPTSGPAAPAPSGARFAARRDLLLVVLLTAATAVVSDCVPALRLLAQGHDVSEIGEQLGISAKTVANLQTSIKQKLGASPALQLIVMARQLGVE
jgi:FixJ family two-component response regulator